MPKWWLVLVLIVIAIYLNRSYAYFYDLLDQHRSMPLNTNTNLTLKSSNPTKPKLSYVALGDSLTFGEGVEDTKQTFPYLIAQGLSKNQDVELLNLGVPGAQTQDVIKQQIPKLHDNKADLVTLMIGINDTQILKINTNFEKNFAEILDDLTLDPQRKVVVINIPPLTHSKAMLFPYKYIMDLRINQFNSIITKLVNQKKQTFQNLVLIDLYSQTKNQFQQDDSYFSNDYFHPSSKGYKLWSEIILNDINN